jgi:4-hydroxy-3-polyprenylbenzoate decarboxylase
MKRRLIIGMSGSSAPIYGIRLLEVLRDGPPEIETHLIMSAAAEKTIALEAPPWTVARVRELATRCYDPNDVAAGPASGSFRTMGMVIAPASMKTLAAVAHGYASDLLTRAADVTLKERRPLVLVARETPLHLGHLRNMVAVTEMGAIVLPPMVAFYHQPRSIEDIVDHTVGKMLDVLGIEHSLFRRWGEDANE